MENTKTRTSYWHPMHHPRAFLDREPIHIVRGEGCYVIDESGHRMVDAVAGLWNVNVGHDHPHVKAAIVEQLDELEYFQTFDGVAHPRVLELSAKLVELLEPEGMSRVILSSGGSDAVETALKVARQYWKVQGLKDRTKFVSLRYGYHGTHFGGVSVNGNPPFRRSYEPLLPGCFHVDPPWTYRNPYTEDPDELARICADLLEREIVFQGPDTVAAFIAEPVLGAGGVIVPPPTYWPLVREVCDRWGVLMIADEVVTGFGRTGWLFGCRMWGVAPDVMCLAKGISSGYVPLGATVVSERVASVFEEEPGEQAAIMHGYTYAGHPLACAAALASIEVIERDGLVSNAREVGAYLLDRLRELERFATVGEVRGVGLMAALDLVQDKATREPVEPVYAYRVAGVARRAGAIVRPVGSKIIVSPPLVLERGHADVIASALEAGLAEAPL